MEMRLPDTDEEGREIARVVRAALLSGPIDDENFERFRAASGDRDSLAMFDDGAVVGHVAAFRFDTTVPGGTRLPMAGVTGVGVLPTHTRRGVLTRLMTELMRGARERGQPLASLRASEAPIYGRFGFGLAGDQISAVVRREGARPFREAAAPGSMRLLAGDEPAEMVPPIYDRAARRRVGTINRFDWYWERLLREVNKETGSMDEAGTFVAVHQAVDGSNDGFVRYSVSWAEGFGENYRGEGKIHDLWGTDDAVERALWQYLLDIDLIVTWRAGVRPTDDPIRRTFHDVRAYRSVHRVDEQWVRVLDVDAALRARTYGPAAESVVIEVVDPLFEENCSTWAIDRTGARRAVGEADVTIDVTTLGSAYLGGISWYDLRAAGELTGGSDDTLAALDALFLVRPTPFCGTDF